MKLQSRIFLFLLVPPLTVIHSYEVPLPRTKIGHRRFFLARSATAAAAATIGVASSSLLGTNPTWAATDNNIVIKVTPMAHTFITSSGTAAKPIRENDVTRFFTNAKVVYLLEGNNNRDSTKPSLVGEILDLTVKRKAGEGPGVTPGKVKLFSNDKSIMALASEIGIPTGSYKSESTIVDAVVTEAKSMIEGDVLLVGPIISSGVAADGKLLTDTAKGLGTFVGGKTGRGVVSVLMDGPREGLQLEQGGYPLSELLWYSF